MSDEKQPERIVVIWSPQAREDVRAIERETAMQILYCIDRYLVSRAGDLKKLKPPLVGFRLRCGDYRVFFDFQNEETYRDNRREESSRGLPLSVYPAVPTFA